MERQPSSPTSPTIDSAPCVRAGSQPARPAIRQTRPGDMLARWYPKTHAESMDAEASHRRMWGERGTQHFDSSLPQATTRVVPRARQGSAIALSAHDQRKPATWTTIRPQAAAATKTLQSGLGSQVPLAQTRQVLGAPEVVIRGLAAISPILTQTTTCCHGHSLGSSNQKSQPLSSLPGHAASTLLQGQDCCRVDNGPSPLACTSAVTKDAGERGKDYSQPAWRRPGW